MIVAELIAALQQANPSHEVVLSRDEEGNGFRPLRSIAPTNNNYSDGEIRFQRLTDALRTAGYSDEDVGPGVPCVVLWP